ncbi:LruC domain-containing protein [Mucilaginibacter ginkgonis]|uniref:LruC domain-containing protein n=1 Tax=Mucilaginibacter ginkgonis TaxID=2682091 RepID=A0A6I4ING7_9SPHI|nr:LruC domain-containing protein [Mucilaginibacter ginkgonis]QQL49518.1 LruC domain-containing protein [Mucilaginibacter ginkgonis]
MKKIFTYLLVISVAALASCKKDNNTGTQTGTGTTSDVKIAPDGFNFNTTKSVNLTIALKTNDNNPISGVVVSVYLPDTAVAKTSVFKGLTNRNGEITATINVPTQYSQLIIDPAYVGLLRNALANINGVSCNVVIGGFSGFAGDVVAPAVTPTVTAKPNAYKGVGVNGTTSVDYAYPSPYDASNAIANPLVNGVPVYLDPTNNAISSSLLSYINASLPEGSAVPDTHPQYISNTAINVIKVTATTDLYVTFVSEGAGYLNTLGWYSYPTNNPPTNATQGTNNRGIDKITAIFPNASASGSGGGLVAGNRVKIGTFTAGTTVAFCLMQNAWSTYNYQGTNYYYVNTGVTKFYSQDALNPESNSSLQRHQVMLYDNVNNVFVYGFEDINRTSGQGSDQDFNDIVYYVNSSNPGAISTTGVAAIDKGGDSDGDGVPDTQDAFPNDPTRAYVYYYPSATTYGNYAFEDNFPNKGDYDMNDLIVKYRYTFELNASNQVVDMVADVAVNAAGASFKDGFGIQLPLASSSVASVTGQKLISNYITLASNGVEAGQTYATIIPFDNYNALANNADNSFFINTLAAPAKVTSNFASVKVTFTSPVSSSNITAINPFIICNLKRGYEAHQAGYAPTDKADKTLFGTGDDTSNPQTGRYYLSKENWPWAVSFLSDFTWPLERVNIISAYPHFADWAAGGGSSFTDWYSNTASGYRVNSNLYTK